MIANAFGGNIIEYDAQYFLGTLDLSNYEYVGHLGNNTATSVNYINVESNYWYFLIFSQSSLLFYGLDVNNNKVFSYIPYRETNRIDPLILKIKFNSNIKRLNAVEFSQGSFISVYKEK